jgi:hypothetical protein
MATERVGREETDMVQKLSATSLMRHYHDEWLLIEDPKYDARSELVAGSIRFHSPRREEIYREAKKLGSGNFAVVFAGRPTKEAAAFPWRLRSTRGNRSSASRRSGSPDRSVRSI